MKEDTYDENYFLHGQETGKSLYSNYRWMPDLTIPMVKAIVDHCGIVYPDTVIDFGCARGYIVKAFRTLGHNAYGVDVSQWAIDNCDPDVKDYVVKLVEPFCEHWPQVDWVIAKDVLEHVDNPYIVIDNLMRSATKGVFVVVPLSLYDYSRYVIEDYEKDITHQHRWSLSTWSRIFMRVGWSVESRYRLEGVKDNYSQYPQGNGFITCRRIA